MWSFLTFFIVSLMILVLSTADKVHQSVVQNYMAGLLIISTLTIYGLYYVGKLVDDITLYNENMGTNLDPQLVCSNSGVRGSDTAEDMGSNITFVGER